MYKCEMCGTVSQPREKCKLFRYYRTNEKGHKQIDREVKVCCGCQQTINQQPEAITMALNSKPKISIPKRQVHTPAVRESRPIKTAELGDKFYESNIPLLEPSKSDTVGKQKNRKRQNSKKVTRSEKSS